MKDRKEILYQERSVVCWIDDFKLWLEMKEESFPLRKDRFLETLLKFSVEDKQGKLHRETQNIGFIDE